MWYVTRGQEREGPLSDEQLHELARTGRLGPADLLYREGVTDCVPASSVAALFPAPPAPQGQRSAAGWASAWWLHLRRALAWDLENLPVTAREQARLAGLGVHEPALQRYLAWRRSVLVLTCLPVTLIALLTTLDRCSGDESYKHGFGNFWRALQILAPYALPVSAVAALLLWPYQGLSRRLVAVGWLIAFLVPILLFLVPADWVFDIWHLPGKHDALFHRAATIVIALVYFVRLCVYLPVFLASIAFGVQRACLRLKSLFPQSSVPGLFLIVTAPLFPLVLFPFFVLLNQVASSPLLLGGMWLLLASPLVYAAFGRSFLRPLLTARDRNRLIAAQAISKVLFWVGTVLLLIYATTHVWEIPNLDDDAEDARPSLRKTILGLAEDSSMFRPWDWRIVRWLAVESLGRTLFTTVVVTDLFVRLNRSVGHYHKQLAADQQVENYDRVASVLEQPVKK
jgi:hypothetical protein